MKTASVHITKNILKGGLYILIFALGFPVIYYLFSLSLSKMLGDPFRSYQSPVFNVLGFIIAAVGLYLIVATTIILEKKGRGLPLSSSPPAKLVTSGPYRWVRHPIYVGALLLFIGIMVLSSTIWGLLVGVPMLAAFYFSYARGIEEPLLLKRYGQEYRKYRLETPFIPYPLRSSIKRVAKNLSKRLSAIVNHPKIFRSGDHIIFWGYGIWPGIGVALGLAIMEFIILARGLSSEVAAWLIVGLTFFGLFLTRTVWRFITSFRLKEKYSLTSHQVGFMSWGALLGVSIIVLLFKLLTIYPMLYLADAVAVGLLVAHFWGRIGCMFYGCCFGKSSYGSCYLHYHHSVHKIIRTSSYHERTVIPVQLWSALYGLAGATFLMILLIFSSVQVGFPVVFSVFWYGGWRICEEWLREQTVLWLDFISPAQVFSFLMMLAGLGGMLYLVEGTPTYYEPIDQNFATAIMHPLLLLLSGLLTTLVFSYHFKTIGKWK